MVDKLIGYFLINKWWILAFLALVILDSVFTSLLLVSGLGVEAHPLIDPLDLTLQLVRLLASLLIVLLLSITPSILIRSWLLQIVVVGYSWTILNHLSILALCIDISIYRFFPGYLYFIGFLLQFLVGFLVLYFYRWLFYKSFR